MARIYSLEHVLTGRILLSSDGNFGRTVLWQITFVVLLFFATLSITFLEFITGCVVNLGLGWDVWNYADQPLNLMGQVCLGFTSLWFLLSIPVSELAFWMRKKLNRL